jgi:aspartate/methionine/tyrosine aminotransferase
VVSISSASKEYLLPGARVGYMLCAREELTAQIMRKLVRTNTASPNVLGQKRLLELMSPDLEDLRAGRPPELLTRVREEMRARKERLVGILERHGFTLAGRPGHAPAGSIFVMAALPPWWQGDDSSFSRAAIEEACVSTVPGSAFGLPGTVRLSFGGMTASQLDQLDRNLTAFRNAVTPVT